MTLSEENRKILINTRLDQAIETIQEALLLIENNMLRAAMNRIYYGMFYSLLALALKYKFKTSKHQQLIGWFNKNFIKNNLIDKKYSKIIRDAFELRTEGDYEVFIDFSREEILDKFESMKVFIAEIERFISTEP
ncbi:MAG: HEPN domain-containing protein [Bacteroidetes bacterium]|nr:HEPN domain-containing protein [Bacteroidota bacterium]MBL7105098.1 HEPN domain-containing protein [Bacteroidales bacterium]